jgi:hypothetical protein
MACSMNCVVQYTKYRSRQGVQQIRDCCLQFFVSLANSLAFFLATEAVNSLNVGSNPFAAAANPFAPAPNAFTGTNLFAVPAAATTDDGSAEEEGGYVPLFTRIAPRWLTQ